MFRAWENMIWTSGDLQSTVYPPAQLYKQRHRTGLMYLWRSSIKLLGCRSPRPSKYPTCHIDHNKWLLELKKDRNNTKHVLMVLIGRKDMFNELLGLFNWPLFRLPCEIIKDEQDHRKCGSFQQNLNENTTKHCIKLNNMVVYTTNHAHNSQTPCIVCAPIKPNFWTSTFQPQHLKPA